MELFIHHSLRRILPVDLTDSLLSIRKTFEVDINNKEIAAASLITITLPEGESYLPFTDERYTLIRSGWSH